MNFANVESWVIPEGDVKKVVDSQNRIIWQKQTYTMLDLVGIDTNKTGIIVPISIPGGSSYEIYMDFLYNGSRPTGNTADGDVVHTMGCGELSTWQYISGFKASGSNAVRYMWRRNLSGTTSDVNTNVASYLGSRMKLLLSADAYNASGTSTERTNSAKGSAVLMNASGSTIASTSSTSHNLTYSYTGEYISGYGYDYYFNDVNSYWGFGLYANSDGSIYLPNGGKFTGYIYECYIKVGGEYVYHFLPAMDDKTGRYGLLDVTNNVFYPSCTSNEFVLPNAPITSLSLANREIAVGQTRKITTTITPTYATNQTLEWESSNPDIATVDSEGNVTALEYGTVTIIATTTDGSNISASCTVSCYIPLTGMHIGPTNRDVTVGETITLTPIYYPDNATYKTLTWSIKGNNPNSEGGEISISKNSDQSCTVTGVSACTYQRIKVYASQSKDNIKSNEVGVFVRDNPVAVTSVSVSPSSTSIGIDGSVQLSATVKPDNATASTVTWSSSNSSIASVDSLGYVTGNAAGTATITASCGGKSGTCSVTVTPPEEVTSVTVRPSSVNLKVGDHKYLTATPSPSNVGTVTYSWVSSNTSVATVDSTGYVVAIGEGYTNISCTVHGYNNSIAVGSCNVTVISASTPDYTLTVNGPSGSTVLIDGYGSATDSHSATAVDGTTLNYTVSKLYHYASTGSWTLNGNNKTITVSSLTPVPVSSVSLNKQTLSLGVNDQEVLVATINPSTAYNKNVTWTSSNTSVATVSSSGRVTGKAHGTAIITVTTADGGYTATCTVTVTASYSLSVYCSSPSNATVTITGYGSSTGGYTVTAVNGTTLNYSVSASGYVTSSGSWTLNGADKTITLSLVEDLTWSISPSSASKNVGQTQTFTLSASPTPVNNYPGRWESSNTSVATVSNSLVTAPCSATVTAVGIGTTTISFRNSSTNTVLASATLNVTVPTKSLTIVNSDDTSIYYHKNSASDSQLSSGRTVDITLTEGDELYIRLDNANGHAIEVDSNSTYTMATVSGHSYYKFTYNNVVDNDTIDCYR